MATREQHCRLHLFFPSAEEEQKTARHSENLNHFAMDPKTGDAPRKRKMKEGVAAAETAEPVSTPHPLPPVRYYPTHPPPQAIHVLNSSTLSNPFRLDLNTKPHVPNSNSLVNEKADAFSNFRPSFTSLLSGVDDHAYLPAVVKEQNAHVDQLITTQGNQLRRTMAEIQRRQYCLLVYEAEERAGKKLKEKELELKEMRSKKAELERKEFVLRKENEVLQKKNAYLTQATASLRAQLQESIMRGGNLMESGGCSEEDGESAHVDPERVEPITLVCKACGKRAATMMMWPCRHVCACEICDVSMKRCPVCNLLKSAGIELCLP